MRNRLTDPGEIEAGGSGPSEKLVAVLDGLPRHFAVPASFLLMACIGVIDYFTGYEMAISIFYLLPISLLAWTAGMWPGLIGAFLAAVVWGIVDHQAGHVYSHRLYFFWDMGMRLLLFAIMTFVISALKKSLEQERALARIDHLTAALNSRAFTQAVQAEMDRSRRYGRPFTVAYMDLDKFKSVNDSLGHDAGDSLLRGVADLIRRHMRSTDSIARLGGDEFALLFPETDLGAARTVISKMQSAFISEMEKQGWPVTVSIGCVTMEQTSLSVAEIIKQADNLMYSAKMAGTNVARFALGTPRNKAGDVAADL
jgi:diguanylate cyclase (GGDEF)-like protein